MKKSVNADQDYLASTLIKLFDHFREKILRLVNNPEYSDGIEIIAMLVTVDMLLGIHRTPITNSTSNTTGTSSLSLPSTTATTTVRFEDNNSAGNNTSTTNNANTGYEVDMVGSLLLASKSILQERLNEFVNNQVLWIKQCKEDPKRSTILLPFSKFPAFIDQIKEFSGDKVGV